MGDEEMRLFSTYAVPEKDVRVGLGAVDLVCATSYKCNCFTKSYGKYVKGTGSMVTDRLVNKETWDGRVAVAGRTGRRRRIPPAAEVLHRKGDCKDTFVSE